MQTEVQHIRNISNGMLVQRPGSNHLGGLKGRGGGQNSTFSYGDVAYQIKENDACSNMVANILPIDYPGGGVKRSKLNFFIHGHVAYQSRNHECSHMQAHCLSLH